MLTKFTKWWGLMLMGFPLAAWSASNDAHWDYLKSSALKWSTYDKSTLQKARKLKRPLFVLVYLETCHWCRKYETETLESSRVLKRLRADYLPVAVNSTLQPEVAKTLGAQMVPTTILLTPEGRKMAKFMSFVSERDPADILDANLYRWRKGEVFGEDFGAPEVCCPIDENQKP